MILNILIFFSIFEKKNLFLFFHQKKVRDLEEKLGQFSTKEKGTAKLMADYEKLRKELLKVSNPKILLLFWILVEPQPRGQCFSLYILNCMGGAMA